MVWINTDKFVTRQKAPFDTDNNRVELSKLPKHKPLFDGDVPEFMVRLKYAYPVRVIVKINPNELPFDLSPGFGCTNCGLYDRHPFCSPDHPKRSIAEEVVKGYKNALLIISQNDGTYPWADDPENLSHIQFKNRIGFALRGAEAGTTRYLQVLMKLLEHKFRKIGFRAQAFIPGHCEALCGKCGIKGIRDEHGKQLSCILGGLPSMESWWIDIYRYYSHGNLKKYFDRNSDVVKPMTFVCKDYFTLITMILYDKKEIKKYWYDEMVKERMKDPKTRKIYSDIKDVLSFKLNRRKSIGIPR